MVGESSVLVIGGEAGVGKTALLDYIAERASGCRLLRVGGVESEMGLAFAALLQLLGAPILEQATRLPPPQRDALGRAFGLMEGPPTETSLVSLAALSLLSQVAEERPLLCLVDDAHWLDRESVSGPSFVARRLRAEPIAMLFAVREPKGEHELDGLAELALKGLGDSDASLLLDMAVPGGIRSANCSESSSCLNAGRAGSVMAEGPRDQRWARSVAHGRIEQAERPG